MIGFGEIHWADVRGRPVYRWATVTATSPSLSLTVEGDEDPIGVSPTVLAHIGPLTTGTRVWCQIRPGGAVVIVGRAEPPLLRPLALSGGWSTYESSWAQPTCMVDGSGLVRLDGMVRNGTSTTITTLPVGARPLAQTVLPVLTSSSTQRLDILPSGVTQLVGSVIPSWVSFSGLSFPAAR